MFSKFRLQVTHLLRSWLMDRWLLGAIGKMVVPAQEFKIS
jgi:hypothetical protein